MNKFPSTPEQDGHDHAASSPCSPNCPCPPWSAIELIGTKENHTKECVTKQGPLPNLCTSPNIFSMAKLPKLVSFGPGKALLPLSQLELACPLSQSTSGAGKPELASYLSTCSLLLPAPGAQDQWLSFYLNWLPAPTQQHVWAGKPSLNECSWPCDAEIQDSFMRSHPGKLPYLHHSGLPAPLSFGQQKADRI